LALLITERTTHARDKAAPFCSSAQLRDRCPIVIYAAVARGTSTMNDVADRPATASSIVQLNRHCAVFTADGVLC